MESCERLKLVNTTLVQLWHKRQAVIWQTFNYTTLVQLKHKRQAVILAKDFRLTILVLLWHKRQAVIWQKTLLHDFSATLA